MTGLRDKRLMGYGRIRSIVNISLLILQIAGVGHVGANVGTSSYQQPTILDWDRDGTSDGIVLNHLNNAFPNTPPNLKPGDSATLEEQEKEPQEETLFDNHTDAIRTTTTVVISKQPLVFEEEKPITVVPNYESSPYAFDIFQDGDGSAIDPDGIPNRYLLMQQNDRFRAKAALEATIQWREENNINTILARPHPKFDICKKVFPLHLCGRDETNRVILFQRPGLINLDLASGNELTGEELLNHYIYEMEYLWRILEPDPTAVMTSVIDLTGVNFSILKKPDLLRMVQLFCSTMDSHFPQRAHKTFLINAPRWFNLVFKLISPLLRESTKEKIQILSKGQEQQVITQSLLSECSTDENTDNIIDSNMEIGLREFVSDMFRLFLYVLFVSLISLKMA